jgi:hypothetical protein
MSVFTDYQKELGTDLSQGQIRKLQSDEIMEGTWDNDILSRVAYIYDQDHDDEFDMYTDLHPFNSVTKTAVDIKFVKKTANALDQNSQSYLIMFKPSYVCDLEYYKPEKYQSHFPIPLYIDIPDEKGIYRRWLVCDDYTHNDTQFPMYQVLPCDFKLRWISDNVKHASWCITRKQASYNAGLDSGNKMTTPDNRCTTWLPMNKYTEALYYDQRACIGAMLEKPTVWKVTKVETYNPNGLLRLTWSQDQFNDKLDYIEHDADGEVINVWCDYNGSITPKDPSTDAKPQIKITYSGTNPTVMSGRTKVFTLDPPTAGNWSFNPNLATVVEQSDDRMKLRASSDIKDIGKVFNAVFTSYNGETTSQELKIVR